MRPLQDHVRERIPLPADKVVRILEVGSGPMTIIGNTWEGVQVELYPTDPLADEYARLLREYEITPPNPTTKAFGEELAKRFDANFFDYAQAHNCLDHSLNPMVCIEQMLAVVKPGCCVDLWHYLDEASFREQRGLHQWNFHVVAGAPCIGGKADYNIAQELTDRAEVSHEVKEREISILIRKL